jgi:gluconate 5-dehydrogenase
VPNPLSTLFDLSGRTALVTGGSRGLGLEIAEGLAEAGAHVWITARRPQWLDPALEHCGSGAHADAVACDIGDPAQVERLIGHLDAQAATTTSWSTTRVHLGRVARDDADRALAAGARRHVTAAFCSRGRWQGCAGGYGRIVNVASIAGLVGTPSGDGCRGLQHEQGEPSSASRATSR